MAGRCVILLAVAVAVAVAVVEVKASPVLGDCTHNNQCGFYSCCLVGFMRYSTPSCSPRRGVGEACSLAYSYPSARTLSYPNGHTVELEEAYFGMCPCQYGLVCNEGICQSAVDPNNLPNNLYNTHAS